MSMGAGGGDNMSINVSTNLNGTNAQIDISPTGTGHVHIKPTGVNSVEIFPTFVGEIDNITIGAVTPAAGTFTTLRFNTSLSVNGSTGTSGQVLTSSGAGDGKVTDKVGNDGEKGHALVGAGIKGGAPTSPKGKANVVASKTSKVGAYLAGLK
jgi:hypothetical protein